ncbi:MAG: hypothetical protein ACYTG7_12550 [Planctomycetota bacterium]|jgi:PleD family two-component response regulator
MWLKTIWSKVQPLMGLKAEDPFRHVHSQERFERTLEQQMCRADRTGNELCLVVFHLQDLAGREPIMKRFIRVLEERKRCIDEIGWYDASGIGVILPETSVEGAKKFAEELTARTAGPGTERVPFTLYTYSGEEEQPDGPMEKPKSGRRKKALITAS